jgi:outer membrane cobalamin receptor
MSLITGALPAQYGFRTAGIIDITLKSGRTDPGSEASMTVGSYNWLQPSASHGGSAGTNDWFVTGRFLHNDIGVENPAPTAYPIHDATDQWHALAKATHIIDENTRLSFILAGAQARFQIPQHAGHAGPVHRTRQSGHQQRLADFQLAAFSRYSSLCYQPDPMGDLMFNGNRSRSRARGAPSCGSTFSCSTRATNCAMAPVSASALLSSARAALFC